MYVDNSQDDIIHYGITNDWEEKSVKTKIEFQKSAIIGILNEATQTEEKQPATN